MKKEDKELLLRDLCSRLPYGVKALCTEINTKKVYEVEGVCVYHKDVPIVHLRGQGLINMPIMYVGPYLFPLSSLTSAQVGRIQDIMGCNVPWNISNGLLDWSVGGSVESEMFELRVEQIEQLIDFFNSNHIDYLGLIEKSLAIDATGLNIY